MTKCLSVHRVLTTWGTLYALTLLLGCRSSTEPKTPTVTLHFEGTVATATGGTPIRGATVKLMFMGSTLLTFFEVTAASALTDSAGHYSLSYQEPCSEGLGTAFWLQATGIPYLGSTTYRDYPQPNDPILLCQDAAQTIDFSLTPTPTATAGTRPN